MLMRKKQLLRTQLQHLLVASEHIQTFQFVIQFFHIFKQNLAHLNRIYFVSKSTLFLRKTDNYCATYQLKAFAMLEVQ